MDDFGDDFGEMTWPPPPETTADLFGHQEAEAVLARALSSGRLPHAWLVTGPRGIGKSTLACRFSRYVLSMDRQGGGEEAATGDMFGALPSETGAPGEGAPASLHVSPSDPLFSRIAAGGHADQKIVRRSVNPKTGKMRSEIVVDDVRAAGNFLHKTSAEGGYRIIIVDSADEMNRNAANALLKSLEEPPPRTLILLVSHAPGRLLPTVRSRCRHLPLSALSREDFGRVCDPLFADPQAPELDEGDLDQLFYLSQGAPGEAVKLAEAGGLDLYREMIFLLEGLAKGRLDVQALHELAGKCARGKDGEAFFETFSTLLLFWLSRLVRQGTQAEARENERVLPQNEMTVAENFLHFSATGTSSLAVLDHWVKVWEKLTGLFAQAQGLNLDRKQVVLDAFYTLNKAFPR